MDSHSPRFVGRRAGLDGVADDGEVLALASDPVGGLEREGAAREGRDLQGCVAARVGRGAVVRELDQAFALVIHDTKLMAHVGREIARGLFPVRAPGGGVDREADPVLVVFFFEVDARDAQEGAGGGDLELDRGALALLALMVLDNARGSAATIDALGARAAAKPLGKTVKIKLTT